MSILVFIFAGGGIVSLTVANENLAEHIIMVEIDDEISSIWKTIFYGDVEWLIHSIISFDMNVENINRILSVEYTTDEEEAFKTIMDLFNNPVGYLTSPTVFQAKALQNRVF